MKTMYYAEYEIGCDQKEFDNDKDAVEYFHNQAFIQGCNKLWCVYKESPVGDGLPFCVLFDHKDPSISVDNPSITL